MDIIVLRTYSHDTITEMAASASIPVINALSELEHPCQAIADFMTLEERFGALRGPSSSPTSATATTSAIPSCSPPLCSASHCTVATPKGFEPKLDIIHKAIEIAEATGASITLTHDATSKPPPDADAIYTDVCTSMGFRKTKSAKRAPIFQALPGQRRPHGQQAQALGRLHALPPRPPRRRGHGRRPRRPPVS